jgi:hypothetical protein
VWSHSVPICCLCLYNNGVPFLIADQAHIDPTATTLPDCCSLRFNARIVGTNPS